MPVEPGAGVQSLRTMTDALGAGTAGSRASVSQYMSPTQAAQAAAARQGTTFPLPAKPRHGILVPQLADGTIHTAPAPAPHSLPAALTLKPATASTPTSAYTQPVTSTSQQLRFSNTSGERRALSRLSTAEFTVDEPDLPHTLRRNSHASAQSQSITQGSFTSLPSQSQRQGSLTAMPSQSLRHGSPLSARSHKSNMSPAISRSNTAHSRKGVIGTLNTKSSRSLQSQVALPLALEPVSRPTSRQVSRAISDMPGEARRNQDGSQLDMLQTLDGDDDISDGSLSHRSNTGVSAQDLYALLTYRSGLVGHKGSVEAHMRRMKEREEVIRTLKAWTNDVLINRAPTVPEEDTEHVDAEQLEIESRCTDPDMKPDPHGVGYQLRAYWNATVQEAVEVRFNSMQEKWEKDMAIEMDELRELRVKNKEMTIQLKQAEDKVVALQMKYDMVVRNSRPAAPAPPTPSAQPPASRQDSRLPVQSTAAAAAAAEDSTRSGQPSYDPSQVTPQEVHDLAQEMDRLRAAISEAKKEQETATLRATQAMDTLEATLTSKQEVETALSKAQAEAAVLTLKLSEVQSELDKATNELEQQKKSGNNNTSKPGAKGAAASRGGASSARGTAASDRDKPSSAKTSARGKAPASGGKGHDTQDTGVLTPRSADREGTGSEQLQAKINLMQKEQDRLTEQMQVLQQLLDDRTSDVQRLTAELTAMQTWGGARESKEASVTGGSSVKVAGDPLLMARVAKAEAELTVSRRRNEELQEELVKARKDLEAAKAAPVTATQFEVAVEVEKTRRKQLVQQLQGEVCDRLSDMATDGSSPDRLTALMERVKALVSQYSDGLDDVQQAAPRLLNRNKTVAAATAAAQRTKGLVTLRPTDLQNLLANSNAKLQQLYELGGRLDTGLPSLPDTNPLLPDLNTDGTLSAAPNSYSQRLNQWLSSAYGTAGPMSQAGGPQRMSLSGLPAPGRHSLSGVAPPARMSMGGVGMVGMPVRVSVSGGVGVRGPQGSGQLGGSPLRMGAVVGGGVGGEGDMWSRAGGDVDGLMTVPRIRRSIMGTTGFDSAAPLRSSHTGSHTGSITLVSDDPRTHTSTGATHPHMWNTQTAHTRVSVVGDEGVTFARRTQQSELAGRGVTHPVTAEVIFEEEQLSDGAESETHGTQHDTQHDTQPDATHDDNMAGQDMTMLALQQQQQEGAVQQMGNDIHGASKYQHDVSAWDTGEAGSYPAGQDGEGGEGQYQEVGDMYGEGGVESAGGQAGWHQPRFVPAHPSSSPRTAGPHSALHPVRVQTVAGRDATRPATADASLVTTRRDDGTSPFGQARSVSVTRPMSARPASGESRRQGTFPRLTATYLTPIHGEDSGSPTHTTNTPPLPKQQHGTSAHGDTSSHNHAAGGQVSDHQATLGPSEQPRQGGVVLPLLAIKRIEPTTRTDNDGGAAGPSSPGRKPAAWNAAELARAQDRVGAQQGGNSDTSPHRDRSAGTGSPGRRVTGGSPPRSQGGAAAGRGHVASGALSELDVAGPSPLVVLQQLGGEPPIHKHNLYQPQPDQPAGAFRVRLITATPQKGITQRRRDRADGPASPGRATNVLNLGLNLGQEEGQGPPQVPPPPQPAMLSERVGYTMGLSVPSHTWTLQTGGAPAGAQLHTPGDDKPVYSGPEIMSRMELVTAVRSMQETMREMEKRYNAMNEEVSKHKDLRTELAAEVVEARQHWIAENQYNSMLQEELQRLAAILEMITHTATDIAGLDNNNTTTNTGPDGGAGAEASATHLVTGERAHPRSHTPLTHDSYDTDTTHDSPQVQKAKSLLLDIAALNAQQESHLHEVEELAEEMRLSPTELRSPSKHSPTALTPTVLHGGLFAGLKSSD